MNRSGVSIMGLSEVRWIRQRDIVSGYMFYLHVNAAERRVAIVKKKLVNRLPKCYVLMNVLYIYK